MKSLNNALAQSLLRCIAASVLIAAAISCSRASVDEGIDEGSAVIHIPERGDSAWAVVVATGAFAARSPGYPVRISQYRREGEDHLIDFSPVGLGLGGSGVVRVRPDGTTLVMMNQ
jgi:hypothetical protein